MRNQPPALAPRHRLIGVAATVVVHLALVLWWLLARQPGPDTDGTPAEAIQWVDVRPRPAVVTAPPAPAPAPRKPPAAPRNMLARPAPAAPAATVAAVAAPQETPVAPVAPAPPAKSAYDMMQQARRDIGKIDKEIKKEFPEQHIKKPLDTPQARLEKGFDLAAEMAPPKWYEKAKVTELIDAGGYGRKRYRVITAQGTYCMTYESNHSPNGQDPFTRGMKPKMTNCDADEEPAKAQKW